MNRKIHVLKNCQLADIDRKIFYLRRAEFRLIMFHVDNRLNIFVASHNKQIA